MDFFAEQTFEKTDFSLSPFTAKEYELCIFKSCNFSNCDLSASKFIECEFSDCNFSLAKTGNTILRDARFINCKLLGIMFNSCSNFGFSVSFSGCNLSHSSFYQKKMKGASFKNTRLEAVDFTECDLTGSMIENCDLQDAVFDRTILSKADLRTSTNFSINPEINTIQKARFSLTAIAGLLRQYDIDIDRYS